MDIDGERRSFQIKRNIHTKAKRYEILMCSFRKDKYIGYVYLGQEKESAVGLLIAILAQTQLFFEATQVPKHHSGLSLKWHDHYHMTVSLNAPQ